MSLWTYSRWDKDEWTFFKTRKSSCVNSRGIPTAAYQVLHMLSYPGGRYLPWPGGYLPWPGGYLPWWGVPTLGYPPHIWTWLGKSSPPPSGPGRSTPSPLGVNRPSPFLRIRSVINRIVSIQVTLNAAFWKPEGRTFHQIGTYRKLGWNLRDDVFPNRKFGFNGRGLKIVTNFVSISIPIFMSGFQKFLIMLASSTVTTR